MVEITHNGFFRTSRSEETICHKIDNQKYIRTHWDPDNPIFFQTQLEICGKEIQVKSGDIVTFPLGLVDSTPKISSIREVVKKESLTLVGVKDPYSERTLYIHSGLLKTLNEEPICEDR